MTSARVTATETSTSATTIDLLAACAPVSLAELQHQADLQTRIDRKYILGADLTGELLTCLGPRLRVLRDGGRHRFRYRSTYFDTDDLAAFHGAARERRRRFKVRTRRYLDSGLTVLELKTRDGRGQTVKVRTDHAGDCDHLDAADRGFLAQHGLPVAVIDRLRPTLATSYSRSTCLTGDGARWTLDVGLRCATPDGRETHLADRILVETKSAGPATPVDRWLRDHHVREVRVSKYGTGLAALRADLPANKWHRTLGRYFHLEN